MNKQEAYAKAAETDKEVMMKGDQYKVCSEHNIYLHEMNGWKLDMKFYE